MAHGLDDRSEFEKIISQARHRWLRPAEICDILRIPTRLGLSDKRANLPASGSLFLYDRNVLRHFRNDGHRWKKTKKRKAVKEGHERLKVEGDEVLHCYYAHGEENENFQRRSYWRIERDLSHIVLVHYREVKSNRKKVQARDAAILNTAQASELDTAFTFASAGATLTTAFGGSEDVKKGKETAKVAVEVQESGGGSEKNSEVGSSSNCKNIEKGTIVKPHEVGSGGGGKLKEAETGNLLGTESANNDQASVRLQPFLEVQQREKSNAELNNWMSESLEALDETKMQFSTGADLNTFESENEIDKSSAPMQVRSDSSMLGTFAPHYQLFSIIDFSPNWTYENSESEVVIRGRFLNKEQAKSCKWSCMFGEVEVDAEVIGDGVLRCLAPPQKAGRHPFYVTCSNRMSCSEVREYEYRRIGGGIGGGGSMAYGRIGGGRSIAFGGAGRRALYGDAQYYHFYKTFGRLNLGSSPSEMGSQFSI